MFKRKLSGVKEAANLQEVFSTQQNVPVSSFWKEPTTEVVGSDPASDLLVTSYAI